MKNKDTEVELIFNDNGKSLNEILEEIIINYIKSKLEDECV